MIVGYARTSTVEQNNGLQLQLDELREAGCERVFSEQVSSMAKRETLDELLAFVRQGDTVIVTKLDRLARSITHLWHILEVLKTRQATLRILNIALNTDSATGKLMLSLLGAVAEFEREMMLERQREGIAKAKYNGKKFGRPSLVKEKTSEIAIMHRNGFGIAKIARELSISRASVYRYRKV